MNTALTLAALLTPFALIAFAVLSLIRTTEDDELTERLRHGAPPSTDLEAWLTTLRVPDPDPYDAPTDPVLAAWDGARS